MKWAHEHKVRAETDFIMMARYDNTTDNLVNRLSIKEVEKVINDIIEYNPYYKEEILNASFNEIESRDIEEEIICGVCIDSMCMVANGNIYPCAGWQNYVCGNVRDTSLREIWEKSAKVKYLRSLRKKDFPECLSCEDKDFCAMCMVRNANENKEGNPLIINKHFCNVAAINKRIVLNWKQKQGISA